MREGDALTNQQPWYSNRDKPESGYCLCVEIEHTENPMTQEDKKYCCGLVAAKLLVEFRYLLNPELSERIAEVAVDTMKIIEQFRGKSLAS